MPNKRLRFSYGEYYMKIYNNWFATIFVDPVNTLLPRSLSKLSWNQKISNISHIGYWLGGARGLGHSLASTIEWKKGAVVHHFPPHPYHHY